jgi:hypothetical protein
MRHLTLGVLTVMAALAAGASTVHATDQHAWCLVVQDWGDGWACGFDTFAHCLAEARAGNIGFCAANPSYQAPAPVRGSHKRHKTR